MVRGPFHARARGFGWRPDVPSLKDWPFRNSRTFRELDGRWSSESLDRRAEKLNPPVRDQGNLGSCVGFAVTSAVGFLRRTDPDILSTNYSALMAYYEARLRDGPQWKNIDAGAYIRDAMDALRLSGVAPESRWPYREHKFSKTPPPSAYTEARRWKLGAHWRCNTVEDVIVAIDAGYPVVGGFACYSSMFTREVDRSGLIPMPNRNDQFLGGHAVYFDRYSMRDQLFRFMNSWGEAWGDGGYGYLPFLYVANRNLSDDFWAMQSESPETTPWRD